MFTTKEDLEESLQVLRIYDHTMGEKLRNIIATDLAKTIFDDFGSMSFMEKDEVMKMILSDMSSIIYDIN